VNGFCAIVAAISPFQSFTLAGGSEAVRLAGAGVSWNFFSLLQTPMAQGRSFLPEEDQPGHDHVIILSYGLWDRRFGSDRAVPALYSSKVDLQDALKESGSRLTASSGRARLRSVLVMAEMALAVMLLTGACLLLRSFVQVQQVDPGFNGQNLLTAFVMLPPSKYPEPRSQAVFFRQLMDRIALIPGVEWCGRSRLRADAKQRRRSGFDRGS